MQLDSHRFWRAPTPATHRSATAAAAAAPNTVVENSESAPISAAMPCHMSFRQCRASEPPVEVDEDGVQMQSWLSVRRSNLRMLRKQTRQIVLLMALMEAMRVGPVQIVYAGKQGYAPRGPEDFGIAYNVGYFVSWLYVCAFMIVFVPLFSWWVPASSSSVDEANPSWTCRLVDVLKQVNFVLLPVTIGICLAQHAYYTISTLIYVDARPAGTYTLPANNKKNWLVRAMLLAGVGMSLSFGYGAFQILEAMDLAHVKPIEYLIIVLPVKINLGLLLGSWMQWRVEQRIEKLKLVVAAEKAAEEAKVVAIDEKSGLLIEV